jgi:hypothetical protein
MISALKFCLAAGLALLLMTAARTEDEIPKKQAFVVALQNAIRAGDKVWLAEHTRYPLRYYGHRKIAIKNKAAFLKNYPAIIGKKLRDFVLAQDPEKVFENWQGMMVGDGSNNIWVRNEGDGLDERYFIITINDDE